MKTDPAEAAPGFPPDTPTVGAVIGRPPVTGTPDESAVGAVIGRPPVTGTPDAPAAGAVTGRPPVTGTPDAPTVGAVTGRPQDEAPSHFVYLLRCADGSYYCGYSTDPVRRARVHNSGKGAKYTRSRLPVELVWTEAQPSKEAALSREWHLKRLTHSQKEALIRRSAP